MNNFFLALMFVITLVSSASAVTYDMNESSTNRDGILTPGTTGTFTPDLSWNTTISTAGDHYYGVFIDVDIDEQSNTFFNEYGVANGTAAIGQSWEIDDPYWGWIDDDFKHSDLWNTNYVPQGSEDDVSMALAWDFTLLIDQIASLSFVLSDIAPTSGFYLSHVDPDSNASLFFSSTLAIRDVNVIPEPSTFLLFGFSLAGFGIYLRKKRNA